MSWWDVGKGGLLVVSYVLRYCRVSAVNVGVWAWFGVGYVGLWSVLQWPIQLVVVIACFGVL